MRDTDVVRRIGELADEEHRILGAHVGQPLGGAESRRLREVEVVLDQCWDLLRQRRARRTAGSDPDEATLRAATTVEGYTQ